MTGADRRHDPAEVNGPVHRSNAEETRRQLLDLWLKEEPKLYIKDAVAASNMLEENEEEQQEEAKFTVSAHELTHFDTKAGVLIIGGVVHVPAKVSNLLPFNKRGTDPALMQDLKRKTAWVPLASVLLNDACRRRFIEALFYGSQGPANKLRKQLIGDFDLKSNKLLAFCGRPTAAFPANYSNDKYEFTASNPGRFAGTACGNFVDNEAEQ